MVSYASLDTTNRLGGTLDVKLKSSLDTLFSDSHTSTAQTTVKAVLADWDAPEYIELEEARPGDVCDTTETAARAEAIQWRACWDSGAKRSLIRASLYKALVAAGVDGVSGLNKDTIPVIKVADNAIKRSDGIATVSFTTGGLSIRHTFIVFPDLATPMLIGMDVMKDNINLNNVHRRVEIPSLNMSIPYLRGLKGHNPSAQQRRAPLRATQSFKLAPRQQALVNATTGVVNTPNEGAWL